MSKLVLCSLKKEIGWPEKLILFSMTLIKLIIEIKKVAICSILK